MAKIVPVTYEAVNKIAFNPHGGYEYVSEEDIKRILKRYEKDGFIVLPSYLPMLRQLKTMEKIVTRAIKKYNKDHNKKFKIYSCEVSNQPFIKDSLRESRNKFSLYQWNINVVIGADLGVIKIPETKLLVSVIDHSIYRHANSNILGPRESNFEVRAGIHGVVSGPIKLKNKSVYGSPQIDSKWYDSESNPVYDALHQLANYKGDLFMRKNMKMMIGGN